VEKAFEQKLQGMPKEVRKHIHGCVVYTIEYYCALLWDVNEYLQS